MGGAPVVLRGAVGLHGLLLRRQSAHGSMRARAAVPYAHVAGLQEAVEAEQLELA